MKKTSKTTRRLRWKKAELTSGPFKGPFWGAQYGAELLMIVPRQATAKVTAHFQVWRDGVVHDERPCATVAEAKGFAAELAGR